MLPLLQLNFKELTTSALDFGRLDMTDARAVDDAYIEASCRVFTGQSYAFRDELLEQKAIELNQNLDQLISHQLAYGFSKKPVKIKSLIWLGRRFGCVILTVCDAKGRFCPTWPYEMIGYCESGNDFVGLTDHPYAYWDGNNLHRIYPDRKIESPTGVLLCDLGNGFGWSMGETEPEYVPEMSDDNPDAWSYSRVPSDHEQIVTINGARCILLHSHYRDVRH